jgi:hypothetical protein
VFTQVGIYNTIYQQIKGSLPKSITRKSAKAKVVTPKRKYQRWMPILQESDQEEEEWEKPGEEEAKRQSKNRTARRVVDPEPDGGEQDEEDDEELPPARPTQAQPATNARFIEIELSSSESDSLHLKVLNRSWYIHGLIVNRCISPSQWSLLLWVAVKYV